MLQKRRKSKFSIGNTKLYFRCNGTQMRQMGQMFTDFLFNFYKSLVIKSKKISGHQSHLFHLCSIMLRVSNLKITYLLQNRNRFATAAFFLFFYP